MASDGKCYCKAGYEWDNVKNICTKIIIPEVGEVLGESYDENNPLNLQLSSLVKNLKFVEVFYVDNNLCLQWVVNEKAALKHFGVTWNSEDNIKEFDDVGSHGYKFCANLE